MASPDRVTAGNTWPDASIACVWLPHLPLRVEVLRHPAWDGCPLVLGSAAGERAVVQLCSPEAESAGIRPGLPLREVVPLCQEAIVVQPDPVRIAAVVEEVLAALQRVVPSIEVRDDQFLMDLRGLKKLYRGDFACLERAILEAVPSLLRPRLGVAKGLFTAAVAAKTAVAGGTRVVPVSQAGAFLAPLAAHHLPLEPENVERLNLLGLRTIGDLACLPFSAVQAQFGLAGARAWRLAHGQDDERLVPRDVRSRVHTSLRFDDPIASADAILAAVDHMLAELFGAPGLSGCSARQVQLRALLADGTSWERCYTFKEAVSTRDGARRALRSKLDLPQALPSAAVEEMSLTLLGIGGLAARQERLFVTPARENHHIREAGRQLRARYGRVPLYQVVEVEPWSRIPERRWALVTCDVS